MESSQLRYNYLWDTWVVVAPERERRPHDFPAHSPGPISPPEKCPFEPGKEELTPNEIFAIREPGSKPNSPGWKVRVIPNKYPALRIENSPQFKGECIYDLQGGFGAHEIVIDTPDHFKHPHNFSLEEWKLLLYTYRVRMESLYGDARIKYVLVFKNYGREAGASLSHSHSQIIATPQIPKLIDTVVHQSKRYFTKKGRCYLCDEIRYELKTGERVVYENEEFVVYCPFYSIFPFQMRVAPKKHLYSYTQLSEQELYLLADALQKSIRKLHKALVNPPYNFFVHTSPPVRENFREPHYFALIEESFHWYLEILPRITTPAGFEWGSWYFINPTKPESAAKFLREVVL
ncbi:galactose-1-phosphate uridylyltransferase [Thermovibrio sp.]